MARTRPFERPVRRINGPTLVMVRQYHTHYDGNHRQIPINRVPFEKRTGTLLIILCLEGLAINGSETENVYSSSPAFAYTRGCEMYLEVFPRGRTPEEYKRWQDGLMYNTVRLPGVRTPLVVTPTARAWSNGANHGADGLEHMTLLTPDKIEHYLGGVLPLLGVDPADMQATVGHITTQLQAGVQKLSEMPRR